jgi:hypothetical protein
VLSHLQASVEQEGESTWVSVADLTRLRLDQDDPPSRHDLDGTRKAIARLQEQGLVEVAQQPRPVTRVVISSITGTNKEIIEDREVTVVRLTPTLVQQLEEAEAQVRKAEEVVASHPGWDHGQQRLQRAKREAARLRSQMAAVGSAPPK